MALKKTVTTTSGLTAQDAYHRVEGVILEGKDTIKFMVRSYADTSLPAFQESAFACEYDLSKSNPIAQAYEHVKTQSEFANAQDC